MEAGMHDDRLGAEPWRNLDIGLEITIKGVADEWCHFRDVDRRRGVPTLCWAHARRTEAARVSSKLLSALAPASSWMSIQRTACNSMVTLE